MLIKLLDLLIFPCICLDMKKGKCHSFNRQFSFNVLSVIPILNVMETLASTIIFVRVPDEWATTKCHIVQFCNKKHWKLLNNFCKRCERKLRSIVDHCSTRN